jgi:hypothetical protein
MSNNAEVNTNMAPSTMLTIVFMALKLTGVIDWSWWWVMSPVLIHISLIIIAFLFLLWFVNKNNKY